MLNLFNIYFRPHKDVNLVTEPKPYQKKLTFSEHKATKPTKPTESQKDNLESSKRPTDSVVRGSSGKSLNSFKKEPSRVSKVSLVTNQPVPSNASREPSHSPVSHNSIASSADQTSPASSRSSSAYQSACQSAYQSAYNLAYYSAYLNSTNQTKKAASQVVSVKQPQQTAKLPYLNSFEALMASIYQQHAKLNQANSNQSNGNQSRGNQSNGNLSNNYQSSGYPVNAYQTAGYQSSQNQNSPANLYLQTYGQQNGQQYGQQPSSSPSDLIVCGSCKRVFYNFSIFLQHKQAMCPLTSPADLCITNAR